MKIDNEERVLEFIEFHNLLMQNAPKIFTPWYLPIKKNGKDIDPLAIWKRSPKISCCNTEWKKVKSGKKTDGTQRYKTICPQCGKGRSSWKQDWARLSFYDAIEWIRKGGNIGLAARKDDALVNIDIDNKQKLNDLNIKTLSDCSRKRCGYHFFTFSDDIIPNIPTDDDGEVRSQDQYVVIAGSYVPTTESDIKKELEEGHITQADYEKIKKDPNLGCYTVGDRIPAINIKKEELPSFFLDAEKKIVNNSTKSSDNKKAKEELKEKIEYSKNKSALFDLKVSDFVCMVEGERKGHPLHSSDTDMNFCIDENGLGHCWRHNVSLNAIQYLATKSGYCSCNEAGTPHGAGTSQKKGDYGMIFHAWCQAKIDKYIPEDDPMPIKALCYIAMKHKLIDSIDADKEKLPVKIYNQTLRIVEDEY